MENLKYMYGTVCGVVCDLGMSSFCLYIVFLGVQIGRSADSRGACDLNYFHSYLNSTGGAHCFGRTDFTSISTRPSIV